MARRPPPPNLGMEYTFGSRDVRKTEVRHPPGFKYTAKAKSNVCADKHGRLKRGGCVTQLTFLNGQPMLRFCTTAKKPGVLVPVHSALEAVAVAKKGCACLKSSPMAVCFPTSPGLGRVRKRSRR